jgi:ribonucleoside-triphosphate reductase (thioredoxin)
MPRLSGYDARFCRSVESKSLRNLMSDAKFYESYSRFDQEKGRYETWEESVERVMQMHFDYFDSKGLMTRELEALLDEIEGEYRGKLILGAQRALQFGGDQLRKHHFRLYNCLGQNTAFVTSHGLKTFNDFNPGDNLKVLTHTGLWQNAVVKSYGKQHLNKVTLTKGSNEKVVNVTSNHRWLLHDGTETSELKIGDRLLKEPSIFKDFDFDTASPNEQLYWCYGFVFGDGTVTNTNYSMVRLCGPDKQYENRFKLMGFSTSSSNSLAGDVMAFTGTYIKTLPNPEIDSPELIRAFVRGYLDADGAKNGNQEGKLFTSIQSSNKEAIEFIRKIFPVAGVHIISEKDYTGQQTNFGIRPYTIRFTICDHSGSKYNSGWKVRNIENVGTQEVYCLEVENDHSFILDGGIVTGNCTSSYADRPAFFGEYFYILLCGSGAGFSVQKHHVAKLPMIRPRTKQAKTFVIPDSIEGWAQSLDVLLSSFFIGGGVHPEFEGRKVLFDPHQIRKKGAPISGGFLAPGPEPLMHALYKVEELLTEMAEEGYLQPIHVYDIAMHAADAVLSGGVRRAATICLFTKDDEDMLKAKTGNWLQTNPQRRRSNNSAIIKRDEVTEEEFLGIINSVKQFGEPGFAFVDSYEHCFNPCLEIGMLPSFEGESGWQACNLSEINGSLCVDEETFFKACRLASAIGTLQAAYTDFKFVSPVTKKIIEREALIGVSITGWMNSPDILFDEAILRKGADIVKQTNKDVANLIGINPAARTTCVKPSGSASVLLGTESGIHPAHSKRYIRNVQITKIHDVAKLIKQSNPYMVEDSIWSSTNTDYVVSYPVLINDNAIFKSQLSAIDFLDMIKTVQEAWVEQGTNKKLCVDKTLRHNVSNTVTVKPEEWDDVAKYIFENRKYYTGISLLGHTGDKDYFQAPFIEVKSPEELVQEYGEASVFASGLIVDSTTGFKNLWQACSVAQYNNDDSSQELKDARADWIRRFKKFADNYFAGDMKKTEYCLKDVWVLHKWIKIQQNYEPVNLTDQLKVSRFIDIDTMGSMACVGGFCEI